MRTSGSGGAEELGNDGRGRQEGRPVSDSLEIYNTKVGRANRRERDDVGLGNAEPMYMRAGIGRDRLAFRGFAVKAIVAFLSTLGSSERAEDDQIERR